MYNTRIHIISSSNTCLFTLATSRFKLGFKTYITYISVTSIKKERRNEGSRGSNPQKTSEDKRLK